MASTPLKSYLRDIEGFIGAGQNDEAIAHCLHILQTFPKNIAVYRLIGKAYLESQRYSDATDVFHRILSSVPDDFVSHVGMSIIREDEGNLDESIWHMERAFETQPYNPGIQEQLRRLYGRRDGMEPPKLRLTRGALARLYAKGNLHQQAIGELRAALAEDPQRPDLKVVLAREYYLSGQRIEAVETCSTLLKKYPYCLDANALLSVILPETERAQDAQNYLQRTIALDPFLTDTPVKIKTSDEILESAYGVDLLTYTVEKTPSEENQPAWAKTLGVDIKQSGKEEILPDWLTPSPDMEPGADQLTAKEEPASIIEGTTPGLFPWETPVIGSSAPDADVTPTEAIPNWMKEAGWGLSTGETEKEQPVLKFDNETEFPGETELAPADLPDWLRESAPPGILDLGKTTEEGISIEETLPWLQETPKGSQDRDLGWLGELTSEPSKPAEDFLSIPDMEAELPIETGAEDTSQTAAEIPDWLQAAATIPSTPAHEEELPDWLKGEAEDQKSAGADILSPEFPAVFETAQDGPRAETSITGDVAPVEEFPAWLKEVEAEIPEDATEAPKVVGVTEWLNTMKTDDLTADAVGVTEWLSNLKSEPESTPERTAPSPTEIFPWLREETTEEQRAKEIPELQADERLHSNIPPAEATPLAVGDEIPAWMNEVQALPPEESVSGTVEIKPPFYEAVPADIDLSDQDATLAWLESLAAKQGVPQEEPFTRPEEQLTPEPGVDQDIHPETAAEPAQELPEWLNVPDLVGSGEGEDKEHIDLDETGETTSSGEDIGFIEKLDIEGNLPAGVDLTDQDAALAWLEGLAAKQGAADDELFTKQENLSSLVTGLEEGKIPESGSLAEAEIPDWLNITEADALEIAPGSELETSYPEAVEIPDIREGIPDWLKEVEAEAQEVTLAEVPELAVPVTEDLPESITEDIPDWLKTVEAEAQKVMPVEERELAVPEAQELPAIPAEEIPDWLKGIEAEAQEITPTEGTGLTVQEAEDVQKAPAEEIPDWLIEAAEIAGSSKIERADALLLESEPPVVSPTDAEWIKETELPEWLEKAEGATPAPSSDAEKESDFPAWLADTAQAEKEVSWVPPQTPEPEITEGVQHELVDLNAASLGDLERLPGIGFVLAQNIKNHLEVHGPFTRIEDLLLVPGIVPGNVDYLKEWITVQPLEKEPVIEEAVQQVDLDHLSLKQARDAMHQGDLQEAMNLYATMAVKKTLLSDIILDLQDALYRYPVDISIWQTLGDAYMRNNQLQDALDAYTKAEELLR